MFKILATTTLILSVIILNGCATYSKQSEELISKALSPPAGQALIYVIRAPGTKGRLRAKSFGFNNEEIGKIWADQYLYVFAWPMQMLVRLGDGSTYKLNIDANQKYYLLCGTESSFIDAVLDPFNWEQNHFKVLEENEGEKLVNEYRLSGEFKRVIIGSGNTLPNTKESNFLNKVNIQYEYIVVNV